jgi:hypothetical protein
MANQVVGEGQNDILSACPEPSLFNLTKELIMKPEVNAVLQEVKANLASNSLPSVSTQPTPTSTTPDFGKMSATEAVRWCLKNGITKAGAIAKLTGKLSSSVYTAMWKIKHPKRSKRLNRESKARREAKGASVAKVAKTKKPKIENGYYEDGMETPFIDALNRQRVTFTTLENSLQTDVNELLTENRRLKVLIEHYESLLFKGGK